MDSKLLLKILHSNINLVHFEILHLLNVNDFPDSIKYDPKIRSSTLAMEKKGLILNLNQNIKLTTKGIEIYNKIVQEENVEEKFDIIFLNEIKDVSEDINKSVSDKILSKTGERRLLIRKSNISYSINISNQELERELIRFIEIFHINDFSIIKKAILSYIDDILEGRNTIPKKLSNFIIKQNEITKNYESDLLMYIETATDKRSVDVKNLFE